MAKPKTTSKKFLLLLVGPVNSFPVGLYDTAEAALEAAAAYGIPVDGTDLPDDEPDGRQSLSDAEMYGPFTYRDLDVDANKAPTGYVIVKFAGADVSGYAWVQPYEDRDYVLPGSPDASRKPGAIDVEQELDF